MKIANWSGNTRIERDRFCGTAMTYLPCDDYFGHRFKDRYPVSKCKLCVLSDTYVGWQETWNFRNVVFRVIDESIF